MIRAFAERFRNNGTIWLNAARDHAGLFYLIGAQATLVLLGYVTNVFVARVLGPADTGRFGVVMSVLVWIEVLIIDGVPQALRRYIAMKPQSAGTIINRTWRPQAKFIGLIFAGSLLASPVIPLFLKDPSYGALFRIAFIDILFYGGYWYVNGVLHGLRRFDQLFWMISAYALGKCLLVIGLILVGLGVRGALLGNAFASIVGMAVGLGFMGRIRPGRAEWRDEREFWHFSRWNILYALLTSLLPTVDLWFVRYFGTDYQAGIYSVAASVARVPYFLALAFVSFALPSLASHLNGEDGDARALRRSWRATQTSALAVFVTLLVIVEIFAEPLIVLVFGAEYFGSVAILRVLFPATILYSLLLLENTRSMAIHGMLRPMRAVAATTVVTVAAVAYGAWRGGSLGAALGLAGSMAVGYLLSRRT